MYKFFVGIVITISVYLLFSFIGWSYDPVEWYGFWRFAYIVVCALIYLYIFHRKVFNEVFSVESDSMDDGRY